MNKQFAFNQTGIDGLTLISPFFAPDERGYFLKSFEKNIFRKNGIELETIECYESVSAKGVLRGLHFQKEHWQSKLVRCLQGELFDVAVDLRSDSPTYGQWKGFYLSPKNRNMLFIPVGFAHGFLSMEDDTLISYICGDRYDAEHDGGIRWDDPAIGVDWPIENINVPIVISDKDRRLPLLKNLTL